MTIVKLNNRPTGKSFNNFMYDLLPLFPSNIKDDYNSFNREQFVPVNVKENDKSYLLEIIAPGLAKEDFKISVDNNLLTVSAEKKAETENTGVKEISKEYSIKTFKRSFTIDESIDVNNIEAKYLNGVLTLNLPRKEEVKEAAKEISVQ